MRRLLIAVLFAIFFGPAGCDADDGSPDTSPPQEVLIGEALSSIMIDGQTANSGVHEVARCCVVGAPAMTIRLETNPGFEATTVSLFEVIPPSFSIHVEVAAAEALGEGQLVRSFDESPRPPMRGGTTHQIDVYLDDCSPSEVQFTLRFLVVDDAVPGQSMKELEAFQKFKIVNVCTVPCTLLSALPDILFAKRVRLNDEDNFQLFGVNPDGQDLKRVTDNAFRDRYPSWSNEGFYLAFMSNRLGFGEDAYEAFFAERTMCDVRRITYETGVGDKTGVDEIALSPDATKLAYSAGGDILVIGTAPGSVAVQLTQGAEDDRSPMWSQDGAQVALLRDKELWVMDADGSTAPVLLDGSQVLTAAWSPGPRIAMVRALESLGTLEDDGSLVPFGDGTGKNGLALAWNPDGDVIAIHEETGTIWIVREAGTTEILVGNAGDRIEGLTWR